MVSDDFVVAIQRMVARAGITASAVRNQGAAGTADSIRNFFCGVSLVQYSTNDAAQFLRILNETTQTLEQALPVSARSWGLARKCTNIFLREALYNHYLRTRYNLAVIEPFCEVPLDQYVARGLREESKTPLPIWTGVKNLTVEISLRYQEATKEVTSLRGIARVHLDAFYWGR